MTQPMCWLPNEQSDLLPLLIGVEREGIPGRLFIPAVSLIVSYFVREDVIHILRVLHQKQKFPVGN